MTFKHLYVDLINYPIYKNRVIVERGWTNETDEPYRRGSCIVVKPPFIKKAVAIGIWGAPQDEETALAGAVQARAMDIDPAEILEW